MEDIVQVLKEEMPKDISDAILKPIITTVRIVTKEGIMTTEEVPLM